MDKTETENKIALLAQDIKNLADLYNHQHKRVVILETALLHMVNSIDPEQAQSIQQAIDTKLKKT